jgi:hypothetical protein
VTPRRPHFGQTNQREDGERLLVGLNGRNFFRERRGLPDAAATPDGSPLRDELDLHARSCHC